MKRRSILASAAALAGGLGAGGLAMPRISAAAGSRVLKFVPQADLALLDPIQTTAFVTRNHALLVFDTLYGVDANWKAQPQMAAGHVVESDGKTWKITLRDGLRFHDNTPVLARDVVASLLRWGKRDSFGLALMAVTRAFGQGGANPAEEAVPAAAGCTGQDWGQHLRDHAGAAGGDRCLRAGLGDGGLRPVPLPGRGAGARVQGGVREVRGLRATAGWRAQPDGRAEGGAFRAGGMDHHSRCRHLGRRSRARSTGGSSRPPISSRC